MEHNLRELITCAYEYISEDNLTTIDKENRIARRDDILELYSVRKSLINDTRTHLSQMSQLLEKIDFCNKQLDRTLKKSSIFN